MRTIFLGDEPVGKHEAEKIIHSLKESEGVAVIIPASWGLKVHSESMAVGEMSKGESVLHFLKATKAEHRRPISLWSFEAFLVITAFAFGLFIGAMWP